MPAFQSFFRSGYQRHLKQNVYGKSNVQLNFLVALKLLLRTPILPKAEGHIRLSMRQHLCTWHSLHERCFTHWHPALWAWLGLTAHVKECDCVQTRGQVLGDLTVHVRGKMFLNFPQLACSRSQFEKQPDCRNLAVSFLSVRLANKEGAPYLFVGHWHFNFCSHLISISQQCTFSRKWARVNT